MKLMVSGYFGFGNLGDEEILKNEVGFLSLRFPGVPIRVISKNDPRIPGAGFIRRTRLLSLIRCFDRDTVLITGGGGIFQDGTSIRSLLYYTFLILLARAREARCAVFSSGIGPVSSRIGRCALKKALEKCGYISVRDEGSRALSVSLGIGAERISVTADRFFALSDPTRRSEKEDIIAVSLRSEKEFYAILPVLSRFCAEKRLSPVLIPMQPETELPFYEKIAKGLGCKTKTFPSASSLSEYLSGVRLALGSRLHFALSAMLSGTPSVTVFDDGKAKAVLSHAGADFPVFEGTPSEAWLSEALEKAFSGCCASADTEKMRSLAENDEARLCDFIEKRG